MSKSTKLAKNDRERQILFGLIELYIATGKPVGSNTLKDTGFEDFSSATIRNYFARLEEEGYLQQQHTSGGRIPTAKAIRLYIDKELNSPISIQKTAYEKFRADDTKELPVFLAESAETLSHITKTAVFLSAPRFDHDYIVDLKVIAIDQTRCLSVIITEFGSIQTEILALNKKASNFSLKRIENYFKWRLHSSESLQLPKPEDLSLEEEELAKELYNEVIVRYIVKYKNFVNEDIYRSGFSKLLNYPELEDGVILSNCLSLFENAHSLRLLLKDCCKKKTLTYWVKEDLTPFAKEVPEATILAIPYYINTQCVGAVGILGPIRLPYKELFEMLNTFSKGISDTLTRSVYKHKITFRQPHETIENPKLLGSSKLMLLEDYSKQE